MGNRERWTSLVRQLKHSEPWQRRRALRLLKMYAVAIPLAEILRVLVYLPEDVLPEVLEWLGHWRWPSGVAPSANVLYQCVNLLEHENPCIVKAVVKLLRGLTEPEKIWATQTTPPLNKTPEKIKSSLPLLTIDLTKSQVRLGNLPCDLTQHQKRILCRLAETPGHYVSAGDLYFAGQGEHFVYDQPGDVKSNMRNLRGKLGDDGTRQYYIQSKKNTGYRININHVKVTT